MHQVGASTMGAVVNFDDRGSWGSGSARRQMNVRAASQVTLRKLERWCAGALIISLIIPLPGQPTAWGFTVFPFAILLVPLFAWWIADGVSGRNLSGHEPAVATPDRRAIVWAGVLCSLFAAVSAIANGASMRYAFLVLYVAVLAAFCLIRLPRLLDLDVVVKLIAVDVIILGVLALIQFATRTAFGALGQYFQEASVQNSLAYLPGGQTLKRAQGTFSAAVIFGQWMTYALVFLFGRWCTGRSRLLACALLLGAGGLVVTFTRSAWVLTALGCLVVATVLAVRRLMPIDRVAKMAVAALAAVVLLLLLAPATWTGRLMGGAVDSDLNRRNELTTGGLQVAAEHPLLGVGYLEFLQRAPEQGVHVPERPHNVFVQLASEQGAFVVGAYTLFFIALVAAVARTRGRPDWLRLGGATLLTIWVPFMFVFDIGSDYVLLPTITALVCICLGYQTRRPLVAIDARTAHAHTA